MSLNPIGSRCAAYLTVDLRSSPIGSALKWRRTIHVAILISVTAFTRWAFRSHYLYDLDSVNFALALIRFDPGVHQPHPPGYFLYVCLGRLANVMFSDANNAFVAISIAFSCGAAAVIYILSCNWFGPNTAIFGGLIFVFSPLAWFHGTVALTYSIETFFSALTGYCCWRICCGSTQFILPGAVVVGIAAGFRPSSLLFLCPLLLYSLYNVARWRAGGALLVLLATLLAWFIPMIQAIGPAAYFSSLSSLWLTVAARKTLFNSSLSNSFVRAITIAGIYLLCFGCAALLPLFTRRTGETVDRAKIMFSWVWITPGLLFFTFVYLKFVNSGYLLILMPPTCAWIGSWAWQWYAGVRLSRLRKILIIGTCAAANTCVFIFVPFYLSHREVRRFEKELGEIITSLPLAASPADTIIIGFDSHFLGYRHAGYYLPRYLTVQYPEVRLNSGIVVFAMRNRETWLARHLDPAAARQFILFPLPSEDVEYTRYLASVRTRFPAGHLRTVFAGGHEFFLGPIEDLHVLFPAAAGGAAPWQGQ